MSYIFVDDIKGYEFICIYMHKIYKCTYIYIHTYMCVYI